jgi:FAD:protein FMN transferase
MGVQFRVILAHADDPEIEAAGRRAAREALAEAARLEAIVSDWRRDSEVMALARAKSVRAQPISPELADLIRVSMEAYRATDGDFDFSLGRLTSEWRRNREQGRLPREERLAFLRARSGAERVQLDDSNRLTFLSPGIQLDFGGIAKGWCAERMSEFLSEKGFPSHLVDAGGDLVLGAAPPGEKGWDIALTEGGALPQQRRRLAHCAIASSGDVYRHLEIDGKRYSHVLDPRTGLGAIDCPRITVVAERGDFADAAASALSVIKARGHYRDTTALMTALGVRESWGESSSQAPPGIESGPPE